MVSGESVVSESPGRRGITVSASLAATGLSRLSMVCPQ
jgi:hypothetical protein